eukprot:3580465-Rhodomonas_salina.1
MPLTERYTSRAVRGTHGYATCAVLADARHSLIGCVCVCVCSSSLTANPACPDWARKSLSVIEESAER